MATKRNEASCRDRKQPIISSSKENTLTSPTSRRSGRDKLTKPGALRYLSISQSRGGIHIGVATGETRNQNTLMKYNSPQKIIEYYTRRKFPALESNVKARRARDDMAS